MGRSCFLKNFSWVNFDASCIFQFQDSIVLIYSWSPSGRTKSFFKPWIGFTSLLINPCEAQPNYSPINEKKIQQITPLTVDENVFFQEQISFHDFPVLSFSLFKSLFSIFLFLYYHKLKCLQKIMKILS